MAVTAITRTLYIGIAGEQLFYYLKQILIKPAPR